MSEIKDIQVSKFDFRGFEVRTGIEPSGKIWFVASDVCNTLGLANVTKALSTIPEKDLAECLLSNVREEVRSTRVISETGLYKLIFKSVKQVAVEFQDWVCEDVLPEIRKKGYYIDKGAVAADPDKLDALNDSVDTLRLAEKTFYQKIVAAFKRASDYDPNNPEMKTFLAAIQNKFLYAITEQTAAEIVVNRISAEKENCGMTVDKPVTIPNLSVSKNYLEETEFRQLVNLGVLYLTALKGLEIREVNTTTAGLIDLFDKLAISAGYPTTKKHYSLKKSVMEAKVAQVYKKVAAQQFDEATSPEVAEACIRIRPSGHNPYFSI